MTTATTNEDQGDCDFLGDFNGGRRLCDRGVCIGGDLQMIEVYPVGLLVEFVHGEGVAGKITALMIEGDGWMIEGDGCVSSKVAWWNARTRVNEWVAVNEVKASTGERLTIGFSHQRNGECRPQRPIPPTVHRVGVRDRLWMLWLAVRTWFSIAIIVTAGIAHGQTVADLKLNDPRFDNGPVLTAIFANAGTKPGQNNQGIDLPGGAICFSTPIQLPARSGLSIRCNGGTLGYTELAYSGGTQYGGPASRLVYTGPAGKAAVTYPGVGLDIQGTLVIQNGALNRDARPAPKDGTVGFLMDCRRTPPTGKMQVDGLTLIGFDVGFRAVAREGGSHGDNIQIQNLRIGNCNQGLQVDENQAVGWQVQYAQASGYVENVFNFQDGGDFQCQFLVLTTNGSVRVLNVGHRSDSGINSAQFKFFQIKVDNSAKGWRLVRADKPGMIDLYARGLIGKQATPASDAIDIPPYEFGGQFLDIDFFWNGKRWTKPIP